MAGYVESFGDLAKHERVGEETTAVAPKQSATTAPVKPSMVREPQKEKARPPEGGTPAVLAKMRKGLEVMVGGYLGMPKILGMLPNYF